MQSQTQRMQIVPLAVLAVGLCLGGPAAAQDYARTGWYVGAGAGIGLYTQVEDEFETQLLTLPVNPGDPISENINADIDIGEPLAWNVRGGYRLVEQFAFELQYEMLLKEDFDLKAGLTAVGGPDSLQTWALTANARFYMLTGRIQPFGVVGMGLLNAEVDGGNAPRPSPNGTHRGFTTRLGGGVDYWITEHIGLTAEFSYVLPFSDVSDFDYLTFGGGAQYRF